VLPDGERLALSVAGQGTSAHLRARRVATLVVVTDGAAHYLKCAVERDVEVAGRSGFVVRPRHSKIDRAGVDVRPMTYRFTADLAIEERWSLDRQVLAACRRDG